MRGSFADSLRKLNLQSLSVYYLAQERRRWGFLAFPLGFLAVGSCCAASWRRRARPWSICFGYVAPPAGGSSASTTQAYLLLAMREGRHGAAARLLGYVDRKARPRVGIVMALEQTRQARATLEATLDAETLRRLLDEGALLDEEAVCGLTLEGASAAPR